MLASVPTHIRGSTELKFLIAVLLLVNLYSVSALTTKPAYWYDEALNVELARNFADFGKLDLIVAPNAFSGAGATVGSTGYPITVPLAGFFKVFGFGLEQARIYMLLWVSAFILVFFFVAKKLWGSPVAYYGTLLIATFAPFYGNGRSVMGEIPGFLFFFLSFYSFERKKWCLSGILLGLSVVSKPSVFIFLIPAYALVMLCQSDAWRNKPIALLRLGFGSLFALPPWLVIYADEIARGGLAENILAHFKNPYQEAGVSVSANISHNLVAFSQSTTLLYFTGLLVLVIAALYLNRELFLTHRNLFILSAVYIPLALLQYLKSFGYLRYLIAAEFLMFILFLITLPTVARWVLVSSPFLKGVPEGGGIYPLKKGVVGLFKSSGLGDSATSFKKGGIITETILTLLVIFQTIHLFWFSDLFPSEKAQKTLSYLSSVYPEGTIGIMNVPQVGSMVAPERKYQYLSTHGLSQFGVNPLLLPPEQMPPVIVADSGTPIPSSLYEKDTAFSDGFAVFKKR